jgi:Bacterial protein of unknown function (DUF899)
MIGSEAPDERTKHHGAQGQSTRHGRVAGNAPRPELPLVEQPCPSCTSVVDGLNGAAVHLSDRVNLVIVAKTDPARLSDYAQERGWHNLRLLSSRNNTFNRDYHGETPQGEQLAVPLPLRTSTAGVIGRSTRRPWCTTRPLPFRRPTKPANRPGRQRLPARLAA